MAGLRMMVLYGASPDSVATWPVKRSIVRDSYSFFLALKLCSPMVRGLPPLRMMSPALRNLGITRRVVTEHAMVIKAPSTPRSKVNF